MIGKGILQLFAEPEKNGDRGGRSAEYRTGLRLFLLFMKTGFQREVFCVEGSQKFGRDIENDPLIGSSGADDRSVHLTGGNKDDIGGLQMIGNPFYEIVHISGKEEHDFKKVVVVAVVFLEFPVCQMEQLKRLV